MSTHASSPAGTIGKAPIRWQPRTIPLSYGRHLCGTVPIPMQPLSVPYESKLERAVIGFLVATPGLRFLQSQPFTVRNPSGNGRYTPDLLAVFSPIAEVLQRLGFEMWTVIEVKPFKRLQAEPDAVAMRLRWVIDATGMAAVCLTERDIGSGGHRA